MRLSQLVGFIGASLCLGSSLAAQEGIRAKTTITVTGSGSDAEPLPVANATENSNEAIAADGQGKTLSLQEDKRLTRLYAAFMASPSEKSAKKAIRRARALLKKHDDRTQAWIVLRGVAAQTGDIEAVMNSSFALLFRGWPEQELYWQAAEWAHSVDRESLALAMLLAIVEEFGPSWQSANALSNLFLSRGDPASAFAVIEDFMETPEGGAEGALLYNSVLLRIGRHEEAFVNASAFCRTYPSHLGLRMNLVRAMNAVSLRDSADAVIQRTFEDQGVRLSWKLSYLEISLKDLVSRGEVEPFQVAFNQLLRWTNDLVLSNQALAEPLAFKALVLAHMGLLEEASDCWATVLAMDDGSRFEYVDEAMKIDKALKDWDKLMGHSIMAMLYYPKKAMGYLNLAKYSIINGDFENALSICRQGLSAVEDQDGIEELQSLLGSIQQATSP